MLTEPKLRNGFRSNLYYLKDNLGTPKLQMNFEIALAGYDMTALNVIIHNGLWDSLAYYYVRQRSILNSLTSCYTSIYTEGGKTHQDFISFVFSNLSNRNKFYF